MSDTDPFVPLPKNLAQVMTYKIEKEPSHAESPRGPSAPGHMVGSRNAWLMRYRSVPFVLWWMTGSVLVVTPWSVYKMFSVPVGQYRPFPPLWDAESGTPPLQSSPLWLVVHSCQASALVLLSTVYFLVAPRLKPQVGKAIGWMNTLFALIILTNPFRFSDVPPLAAAFVNVGCVAAMMWFCPKPWRFPYVQRQGYLGDVDTYLTVLGLPIFYFYLKAFVFLIRGAFAKALTLFVLLALRSIHRPTNAI